MNRKMILLAIVAIALATLACTININLPPTQNKTGPTQTENISVPLLSDKQVVADVTLKFGAGNLTLQPGATTDLINGTAKYNVADFKPVVTVDNNNITIDQGKPTLSGIPTFNSPVQSELAAAIGKERALLSPRETQVLSPVAQGLTYKEVGAKLCLLSERSNITWARSSRACMLQIARRWSSMPAVRG